MGDKMAKIKEILKDSKVITILCIIVLCGMLVLTIWEMFNSDDPTITESTSMSSTNIDTYLSMIDGVGSACTYVSYDESGNPIGVIVICKNYNKDTEAKIKTAVHAITGLSFSKICVYQSSNNWGQPIINFLKTKSWGSNDDY